jgi:hypothetical protein
MLNLDRFQKKIVSNIFFDIFLLLTQASLLASMYLGNSDFPVRSQVRLIIW